MMIARECALRLLLVSAAAPRASALGLSVSRVQPSGAALRHSSVTPHVRLRAAAVETAALGESLPPGRLRRISARVRAAYGAYAARCDEDACSLEGPRLWVATRPVRWIRATCRTF